VRPGASVGKYGYKTLKDLARILSLFSYTGAESMGVFEIAKSLQIIPSKVSRMLGTLEAEGFFEKNQSTGKYGLGGRFLELGTQYVYNLPLRQIIHPHLVQISTELKHSSNFAVFKNARIIVVDRVQITGSGISHQVNVPNLPLHASSHGKIFLAYLPEDEQDNILTTIDLVRFTDATVTEPRLLKEELRKVRQRGYALDTEEMITGVIGIAVPVFKKGGSLVAALNVPVEGKSFCAPAELSEITTYLKTKAFFVSQQLGYTGNSIQRVD
jgi:DNA-binding IclR family transcriptional regulator